MVIFPFLSFAGLGSSFAGRFAVSVTGKLTESGRQGGFAAHRLRRHCGNPPPD
jgi:hypothetical protein